MPRGPTVDPKNRQHAPERPADTGFLYIPPAVTGHDDKSWDPATIGKMFIPLSPQQPIIMNHTADSGVPATIRGSDMHYGLELGILYSGRIRWTCPDGTREMGPGDVWLFNSWEPHRWHVLELPCWNLLLWIWPPLLAACRFPEDPALDPLAPFLAPLSGRPALAANRRNAVLEIGRRIQGCAGDHSRVMMRLYCLEILSHLCEGWAAPSLLPHASRFRVHIDPALQLVFKGRGRVGVAEAAQACGMSRSEFSRIFHVLMGVSFARFTLGYRLSATAEVLSQTDQPVKAVASDWGFVDASHFEKHFRKQFGCSAGQYRTARGPTPSPRARQRPAG